jgi:hypothetical protein
LLGWPDETFEPGSEVHLVDRDLKIAKKPYSAPAFRVQDASTAKAELDAAGATDNANVRQMLSVLNRPRDAKPSPAPSTAETVLP